MATAWQDRFTPLANVNSGNELENGDTATGDHITIALENGAYAKKLADQNAEDITDIEQRLTNLGFKYPSTIQSIPITVGGNSLGTIYINSNTSQSLEGTSRQGNRAILNMSISIGGGGSSSAAYSFYTGQTAVTNVSIPTIYIPTQNQYVYIPSAKITYRQTATGGTYSVGLVVPIRVTLKTDGTFELQVTSDYRPSFQLSTSFYNAASLSSFSFKMGYQVNPISS